MRHTLFTPPAATFAASIVMIGLLFLAACSATPTPPPATPTPVAMSEPAAPTLTPEIIATSTSQGDEGLDSVSPTPEPVPTQPVPPQTIPATRLLISPLPSPTPAAAELSPTLAEAVSAQPAPDFVLEGAQGEAITLSDYQGWANVVLVFYRGKT